MIRTSEPREVYEALVADLSTTVVPATIMGATILGVGLIAATELQSPLFACLALVGLVSSIAKIGVIAAHARRNAKGNVAGQETRRFEIAHACTTWSMAASVGAIGASLFRLSDLAAHLIATALLFGYCSGIVSRVSIRPKIAALALTIAAVPCLIAAALVNSMPHYIVAMIFAAFLLGAMESILHGHRNASRHITTKLQMQSLAKRDPLTGLLNRLGLREAFDVMRATHDRVTLFAFDLDRFKDVNDGHGHSGGDEVLSRIADRLRAAFVDGEVAARIGGDEFVVIQPDIGSISMAALAERIHDLIVAPYTLASGATVTIGASLGYASASAQTTLEGMMHDADAASYLVKRDGGGFRPHRS